MGGTGPGILNAGTLTSLERLGQIVSAVGVPLYLVLFTAVFFGWISSPLLTNQQAAITQLAAIQTALKEHDLRIERIVQDNRENVKAMTEAIRRLGDIIRMLDCADIQDRTLRERCLNR